jgi:adenylate kinase family enzyme
MSDEKEHHRQSDDDLAEINKRITKIEQDLQEIIEIYRNAKGAVCLIKWFTIVIATLVASYSWLIDHFQIKS